MMLDKMDHGEEYTELPADHVCNRQGHPVHTEDAWLLDFGDKEVWIPKAEGRCVEEGVWRIPEWLAKKEDLL